MSVCIVRATVIFRAEKAHTLLLPSIVSVASGVDVRGLLVSSVLLHGIPPRYGAWRAGNIHMLWVSMTHRNRLRLACLGLGLYGELLSAASSSHGLSPVEALVLVLEPVMRNIIDAAVQLMLGRSHTNTGVFTIQTNEPTRRILSQQTGPQPLFWSRDSRAPI